MAMDAIIVENSFLNLVIFGPSIVVSSINEIICPSTSFSNTFERAGRINIGL